MRREIFCSPIGILMAVLATGCGGNASESPSPQVGNIMETAVPSDIAASPLQAIPSGVASPSYPPYLVPEADCPDVDLEQFQLPSIEPQDVSGAIVYSDLDAGLSLVDPENGIPRQIFPALSSDRSTGLPTGVHGFSWSPDGDRLAFLYTVLGPPRECLFGNILFVDFEKGEPFLLSREVGVFSRPAWSPDGVKLAFTDRNGRLSIIGAEKGAQSLTLATDALELFQPKWVDPGHLLYLRVPDSTRIEDAQLVLVSLDGESSEILLNNAASLLPDGSVDISDDGRQLAYVQSSLPYLLDLHSGTRQPFSQVRLDTIEWSPSGDILLGSGGLGGIFLLTPGSQPEMSQLDFSGIVPPGGSWGPSGKEFVILTGQEEGPQMGIYNIGQGGLRVLAIHIGMPFDFSWNRQ